MQEYSYRRTCSLKLLLSGASNRNKWVSELCTCHILCERPLRYQIGMLFQKTVTTKKRQTQRSGINKNIYILHYLPKEFKSCDELVWVIFIPQIGVCESFLNDKNYKHDFKVLDSLRMMGSHLLCGHYLLFCPTNKSFMQRLLHSREVNKLKGNLRFNGSAKQKYIRFTMREWKKSLNFSCLRNLRQKMSLLKNRRKILIFNIFSIGNQQTESVKLDFVTTP